MWNKHYVEKVKKMHGWHFINWDVLKASIPEIRKHCTRCVQNFIPHYLY